MKLLSEAIDDVKDDTTKIGDNPPKIRSMFDLVKQGNYTVDDFMGVRSNQRQSIAPEYQSSKWIKFRAGFEDGVKEISKTPNNIQIWGGQATLSLGGITGNKNVSDFGKSLIKSAYYETLEKDKEWKKKSFNLSPSEYDDFSYDLRIQIVFIYFIYIINTTQTLFK